MKNKVTIGVPTYNRPELLREALKRLINQSYSNFEIVVSDNCSDDEALIKSIVEVHSATGKIRLVRQAQNLGAIRNLKFLLDQAQTPYFMWAADDDLLDNTFVEKLVAKLDSQPECALAMSNYDVTDETTDPQLVVEYGQHLRKLPNAQTYRRLMNYTAQPEYYGKIRILWGMGRTEIMKKAFAASLEAVDQSQPLKWHQLPIEMRILSHGDLALVDETLFHAKMLRTSDGKKQSSGELGKMIKMCNESFAGYSRVIAESGLPARQRLCLQTANSFQKFHSLMRVVPFYFLRDHAPGLANTIKYLWFKLLVSPGSKEV
jgi:glycosyltransferase involved in cell wall biosynthesis